MNCHTPTVRFTKDYGAEKPITSEGITCDFCHSVNAIDLNDRANPIRYVVGRDKYGPLRHAQSPAHNVVHSPVHRISEFCGGCHEYKNARRLTILGTYPEWKAGPYAQREAALLRKELAQGTHRDIRKVTWRGFVAEQVRSAGKRNALEARRTLTEFGGMSGRTLRAVRFATIEAYVGRLHEGGNSQSTINKKLRYLRAAFNRAVKRQYIGANPMDGWQW